MGNEKTVVLLLGSNRGHRAGLLQQALTRLEGLGQVRQQSHVYETEAWGPAQQGAFLNQAVVLTTPLTARQVLTGVLQIEESMGRQRHEKWGPRLIDIDLLFFGNEIIAEPDLQVPHPQIPFRRFVLVPLTELLPNFVHPAEGRTMRELLEACSDPLNVMPF